MMIFVQIREKFAKIGAVKTVFALVVYATASQDILAKTAQ